MPAVNVTDETFERLQKNAVALVDDANAVISRALDALEGAAAASTPSQSGTAQTPDLSFTNVQLAAVDGAVLPSSGTYWNSILLAAVRAAAKKGMSRKDISNKLLANHVDGKKESGGYKYVPDADLSIQGLDANGAWKAAAYLADTFAISIVVQFKWQNNPKAAAPGVTSKLTAGNGVFD